MSASEERRLRTLYAAFNSREVDAVMESMHPKVDWPNAWEGERLVGREAVRAYWARQFESIRSTVEPERFERRPDCSVAVTVHQVVCDDDTDELPSDTYVIHRYWFEDGLVARMVIEKA